MIHTLRNTVLPVDLQVLPVGAEGSAATELAASGVHLVALDVQGIIRGLLDAWRQAS